MGLATHGSGAGSKKDPGAAGIASLNKKNKFLYERADFVSKGNTDCSAEKALFLPNVFGRAAWREQAREDLARKD
jgi:hypothetical protein